jgi:hypothetical protein
MAEDNLILRPKVDTSSAKRSANKMAKIVANANIKAIKKVASFTRKAMTRAFKEAARAGRGASEQAFSVGLDGALQAAIGMVNSIDETTATIEERVDSMFKLVNAAKTFSMKPEDLYVADKVGSAAGVEIDDLIGILGAFKTELGLNEELKNFKGLAQEKGTLDSLLQFYSKYVTGQDIETQQKNLQTAGLSAEDAVKFDVLVRELKGITEISKVNAGGANRELIKRNLDNYLKAANVLNTGRASRGAVELAQGGNAVSQAKSINDLERERQKRELAQQNNLKELVEIRKQSLRIEASMDAALGDILKEVGKMVEAYEKGGLSSAFAEFSDSVVTPISEKISAGMDAVVQAIKDSVKEAVDSFSLFGSKKKVDESAEVTPPGQTKGSRTWLGR